jgi:hypothetical protein
MWKREMAQSRELPIAASDVACVPLARSLALLFNLDPPQFTNLLLPRFRGNYLWLGTKDKKMGNVPADQIRFVYFKKNGQRGAIKVSVRAEFIGNITSVPPDDPEHRLPGFESNRNDRFYLKIRNIEQLPNPKPIESLVCHWTRKSLLGSSQGVQLIDDPLTPPATRLKQ